MVVRAGGTLYTDIYDRKPPLPPLLYAASFSLTDSTDIRLMRVLVTIMLAAVRDPRRARVPASMGTSPRMVGRGAVDRRCDGLCSRPMRGRANYAQFALLPEPRPSSGRGEARSSPRSRPASRSASPSCAGRVGCSGSCRHASASVCTAAGATFPRSGRRGCHGRHNRLLRTPRPLLGMERHQQPGLRVWPAPASGRPSAKVWRRSPGSPHFTRS